MAALLITGGAGFIGSHTCLELLGAGHSLVVLDDFSNSSPESLRRVAELAGLAGWSSPEPGCWCAGGPGRRQLRLHRGDVRSEPDLERLFRLAGPIDAVLHFAGLKAVGESVQAPLRYWDVNLGGSRVLLETMQRHGCRTLVFSSSATIYGHPALVPTPESAPVRPINPYGHSKAAVEQMLADVAASAPGWRIARLRYFNPVGAHPSGLIGEDPGGLPSNLFPLLLRTAAGDHPRLQIYGGDWPTADGTGVRDYVHVMDLAEGHRAALELLLAEPPQLLTVNLGSGEGHSVLEVLATFERCCGVSVPHEIVARRPGDSAVSIADPRLAARRMGWHTRRNLTDICRDGFAWQKRNPHGYRARQPRGEETQAVAVWGT